MLSNFSIEKVSYRSIKKLVNADRLDSRVLDFDLSKLSEALRIRSDKNLKYLGAQILYDRYFIRLKR